LLLDVNIPSKLEERAFFGNFTYYITSNFDITVGARVAEIDASVEVVDGPELIINDTPLTKIDDTVDTYSFAMRYRPADDLSLYARVASGYRPATANLPILDENGNSFVPAIIETDTLWSYEVGAKGSFLDGKVSYDTAVWYLNWKDLQARIYVNGVQTGGNANGDVTAYGFEGAIHYTPVQDFILSASLAYTRSTLDNDETSAFGAVDGENLPLIPKLTAALRASKTFSLGANAKANIDLGLRYIDEQDTGFEGGIGKDGSAITPRIVNFDIEDRFVADLNIGFEFGNFGVSLYATNLFDEYGYVSGSARPQLNFIRATASVAEPRTIGGIIKYKF
jgi:iron complex outermembrane receptor protein